ncbi:MAG: hypothetical protein M1826_000028 [Phylliscum demangeonii]|nr:MAG: hypothetical protein M1826_000028 [Phylliscum demangeonii]
MADKYLLHVTAGPSYDPALQQPVHVNSLDPIQIRTKQVDIDLFVRIQNYRGLPQGAPRTSPYFSHPDHVRDQYSIAFNLHPKQPISGNALIFGNDFERPIRDRLPPGFGKAMQIVKWLIDPGLDGDPYADQPHLYGPALSSINVLRVGEKQPALDHASDFKEDGVIKEGGDGDGEKVREEKGVPPDAAGRRKHFLAEAKRKEWEFEAGRLYRVDFFNGYLDFSEFAVKLPGFSLSILRFMDAKELKSHALRYVLKNKETDEVYFVIVFNVLLKDDLIKEKAETSGDRDTVDGKPDGETFEPQAEDLD